MMKRYLMLCAFILSTLTLLAHDDKVTGILETDMVSFPGGKCQMYRLYLKDKDLDHTPFSKSQSRSDGFAASSPSSKLISLYLLIELANLYLINFFQQFSCNTIFSLSALNDFSFLHNRHVAI